MEYRGIRVDTGLKKITTKDSLFHGHYCVDPYQNCEFQCHYCDSSLENRVYVKVNICGILHKELPGVKQGRIIIGSVHDPYQNAERTYQLTRSILEVISEYSFPCHILTKSPLVLRDIDLLSALDCCVTVSLIGLHDRLVHVFEPQAPAPQHRLQVVDTLRRHGIVAGLALIPSMPYLVEPELKRIVNAARHVDAQYLLHSPLQLKGDQRQVVFALLHTHYPELLSQYHALYDDDVTPPPSYTKQLTDALSALCQQYNMPTALPRNVAQQSQKQGR
ncbi:MAG: hypothetical protein JXA00_05605 [Candidatus Thermoplasmatota archaeon]|nr:hypothetical protein [Candidatus Thermoplasmatota archaeon]